MATYCRRMELKYELQQVLSPRQFLSQEERLRPPTGHPQRTTPSRHSTDPEQVKTIPQFQQIMESHGIRF